MGGAALHFGWVAEMKTGEGKTLVATLPGYLNGLGGRGMHIVTVNDYLARRDSEWMGAHPPLARAHRRPDHPRLQGAAGREAAASTAATSRTARTTSSASTTCATTWPRRARTRSSVATSTPSSTRSTRSSSTRPARHSSSPAASPTPPSSTTSSRRSCGVCKRDDDYEVDEEKRTIFPTEEGIENVEHALGLENLYDEVQQNLVHQLTVAIKAKELYKRDKDYIVQHGEVKIVDEFTGRILEGRRWSEGIHQAVEAKEGVKIKEENQTLATITLQNYFRMYDKLAGMTGTATTEAAELMGTYELERRVRSPPTSR